MTQPRYTLISLEHTPYYHIISRCVRRAFLCGHDKYTGKNYNHRRKWIKERIESLQEVFCIDIAAYAIMSNHYHLVIHINKSQQELLADADIIKRWSRLFKIPGFVKEELNKGKELSLKAQILVNIWRKRLTSVSWFVKSINEYIAKKSNKEDECTGRFWEGRFKSQSLLDQKALITCMAYVDLNPIRAAMSTSIKNSDYTSAQERQENPTPTKLMHFSDQSDKHAKLPFTQDVYTEILNISSRLLLETNTSASHINAVMSNINESELKHLVLNFETTYCHFAGTKSMLEKIKNKLNFKKLKGLTFAKTWSTSLSIGSALV